MNPQIIYAAGSGQGAGGPEAGKGGYDSISFWSRGSVSASLTRRQVTTDRDAIGCIRRLVSGMALAGGIAAALAHKATTGEGALVDGSLLGTAMWSMQMAIVGAAVAGIPEMPKQTRDQAFNPLVNNYCTSDGRWIALCMLQPDLYWEPFCWRVGRDDLVDDPRFATGAERATHGPDAVAELDRTFATKTLAEWKPILGASGASGTSSTGSPTCSVDPQAEANGFVQRVDYGEDRGLPLVANPIQFDREAPLLRARARVRRRHRRDPPRRSAGTGTASSRRRRPARSCDRDHRRRPKGSRTHGCT